MYTNKEIIEECTDEASGICACFVGGSDVSDYGSLADIAITLFQKRSRVTRKRIEKIKLKIIDSIKDRI